MSPVSSIDSIIFTDVLLDQFSHINPKQNPRSLLAQANDHQTLFSQTARLYRYSRCLQIYANFYTSHRISISMLRRISPKLIPIPMH